MPVCGRNNISQHRTKENKKIVLNYIRREKENYILLFIVPLNISINMTTTTTTTTMTTTTTNDHYYYGLLLL